MLLTMTTRTDSYIQFITVLIIFVFVLALTYAVTRWIARSQKESRGSGNLEIIETCRISTNKYLQIVRAGEKYLVIAVGKEEVHMLAQLDPEEIRIRQEDGTAGVNFASVLEKVRKLKEKEKD